jgi:hypothetical protein
MFKQGILLVVVCSLLNAKSLAQEAGITLSQNSISLNEEFSITLTLPKNKKKEFHTYPYYVFPQIEDMVKKQTQYLQDEITKDYKIVQYYAPRKEGVFILDPFSLVVNGKAVRSKGLKINVSSADLKIKTPEHSEEKGIEFKKVTEDIFFKLLVNKTSVYLNEGISVSVSLFYTTPNNSMDLTFIDLNQQLAEIKRKIRPSNCWTEEQDISEKTQVDTVFIGNKKYFKWNIYQGVFFPLDTNHVIIPALDFKLITYQTALSSATTSIIRKAIELTLHTYLLKIKVKNLPPHPLRNEVSVGSYQMEESLHSSILKTGKSFNYSFTIMGEGNISALGNPLIKENDYFEFYSPKITQRVVGNKQSLIKEKSFNYYVLPKEPGSFHLGDYIYWVYFNPHLNRYDTLSSKYVLKINGESQKNSYISSSDLGSFYNAIDKEDNNLKLLKKDEFIKLFANFIILFMLVTTAILIMKK